MAEGSISCSIAPYVVLVVVEQCHDAALTAEVSQGLHNVAVDADGKVVYGARIRGLLLHFLLSGLAREDPLLFQELVELVVVVIVVTAAVFIIGVYLDSLGRIDETLVRLKIRNE